MSEWIDVKQEMPPDRVRVLVFARNMATLNGMSFATYHADQPASMFWHGIIMGYDAGVTHWMTSPEPPK